MERDKFFLDVGAFTGDSADFWYQRYPDYQVICFEPLQANCEALRAKGYYVVEACAWVRHEKKKFYTGLPQSGSLYSAKRTGGLSPDKFIEVECIDIARFIKTNFRKSDRLVMKLNCEGAEYNIIPHLKKNNLLDWIDRFYIQWHWDKIGLSKAEHDKIASLVESYPWHAMTPKNFKNFKPL